MMVQSHLNQPHTHGVVWPQWQKQTVQQFFSGVNWEDYPPELQPSQTASSEAAFLSWRLTVNQFFSAINWEGGVVAAPPQPIAPLTDRATDSNSDLTLDDFSDLF